MSQNPFSQKVKIYTGSAIILTVVAVLLRILNFLLNFDTSIHYFYETPLHLIYRAVCILTVAWLLTSLIFIPRYSFPKATRPAVSNASRLTALFCAVLTAGSFFFFRVNIYYYASHAKLYQLLCLFSLLSAVYFFLQFLANKPVQYTVLTSYTVILWIGLILCVTYLNLYVAMNSPFKITLHMALLGFLLYLSEEARMLTDHSFRISYLACTMIALLNCALSSIPVLIAYAAGVYRDLDYLFYAVLTLGFLLYLCPRAYDCYRVLIVTPQASPEEIAADKEKKRRDKEEKKNKKAKKQDSQSAPTDQTKGDDTHVC